MPPIDDTMSKHKMHALALKPNVRKIFKSIDSGRINGNPGFFFFFFFPCAKRELITLFSKVPCRGSKGKYSVRVRSPLPGEKGQEPAYSLALQVEVTSSELRLPSLFMLIVTYNAFRVHLWASKDNDTLSNS